MNLQIEILHKEKEILELQSTITEKFTRAGESANLKIEIIQS